MAQDKTCRACRGPIVDGHENPDFPFCSRRCRLVDLGAWFGEEYRIPGPPAPEEELTGDDRRPAEKTVH